MARNTGVPETMDIKTLSHIVSLRQKDGLHIDYQYGLVVGGDWHFVWPDPKYNGCSLRVFIYNMVNSHAKVRMGYYNRPDKYFGGVDVNNSTVMLSYGDGRAKSLPNNPTGPNTLGAFFSIGLRIDGNLIRPLVNEWVGNGYNTGYTIAKTKWKTTISSGANYIVSLHLCDEVGGSFPSTGLNQKYGFNYALPIGSYVTIFAVFMGGTRDGQKIVIYLDLGDRGSAGKQYHDTPLKANEEFRITAINTYDGWLLTTSFDDRTQTKPLAESEEQANMEVTNNCYIRRILAVCGPIPEQYRPK